MTDPVFVAPNASLDIEPAGHCGHASPCACVNAPEPADLDPLGAPFDVTKARLDYLAAQRAEHDRQVAAATEAYEQTHPPVMPPATPSTSGAVLAPVPLDHLADTITAYANAKREAARWTETAETLRATIEGALGDAQAGTVAGRTAVTWKQITSRRVDTKALAKAHPALVETFRVESTSRRFELAGER